MCPPVQIHARLSASGAHRWINCPGSVEAEDGIGDRTSPHALEGTIAHSLAEQVLDGAGSAWGYEGKELPEHPGHTVSREMCSHVQEYVDFVVSLGGTQMYEQRVDFSDWVPEGFGTSDAIVIADRVLICVDLKYGKGVRVDAEENPQGLLYALGAYADYGDFADFDRVRIVIHQPRLDHVSEWEISTDELLRWGEWVSERAHDAAAKGAKRTPGEKQCQWCKAKATCPALEQYTRAVVSGEFDDLDSPDTLSDDKLRGALDAKKLIVSWLDAVESHIRERVENGEPFPGYKLVAGRSLRQWSDEGEAETVLLELIGDAAHERKLLSPSKAEKALGKKRAGDIQPLIVKPEGKPVLVADSDKRPPLGATPEDFD